MNVVQGEMDERQILAIIGRYNALSARRVVPIEEAQRVLDATVRDLEVFFAAFGYTVGPVPARRREQGG